MGVGQTKGLLTASQDWGLPATEGQLFPQRKVHGFVAAEMSHLHRGARGVWERRREHEKGRV